MLNGLLRIGIVNEELPYAEPHVWWCERTENESRRKTFISLLLDFIVDQLGLEPRTSRL